MSNKTRRHIWPGALVASLAIVGVLAALLVLTWNPMVTEAHGGGTAANHCSDINNIAHDVAAEIAGTTNADGSAHTCANPGTDDVVDPGNGNGNGNGVTPTGAMLKSSSTTGSAGVELTFTSDPLTAADVDKIGRDGGSVELFLEDDFKVPDSISPGSIYFTLTKPTTGLTGGGGRVRAVYGVEVNDGDFFGGDDDWAIQVYLPDLYTASVDDAAGFQGAQAGQTLTMVITKSAGIKNPSEAGKHSVGYKFLGTADDPDKDGEMKLVTNILDDDGMSTSEVATYAKISLSVDNGGRGKEVTITGSGFNNDTDAEAFVLVADDKPSSCMALIDNEASESLGTAAVGSDDKFSIAFTVHQDEFDPGMVNWICAKDSESDGGNRYSSDVDGFKVNDSLSITPEAVASGEEVTLKPRDFMSSATLKYVYLGGTGEDDTLMCCGSDDPVQKDGSDYVFDMPGGYSGSLRITVKYSDGANATDTITVTPSSLTLNQTEVAPNQSIIVSGSGFNDRDEILTSKITIDGKMLKVDDAGTEGSGPSQRVSITSSGQFTVTVNVWHDGAGNPALDADEYTIKVTDESGYEGKTKITILEPTVMVTPQVAGPRDFITISGTNWPVSTSEDDYDVSIEVDGKTRTASIDSSGRFNYEYRLSGGIGIGEEHDVKVTFTSRHNDKIEEETTFSVPSSNVVITPAAAVPGQTIDLEISGMPIGELVSKVTIDGGNRLGGINLNTDRNGDVTITGIVVPYSEPGFYPVKIEVGTGSSPQIAIVQLEILAEGAVTGVTTALPGALSEVSDNLVRVFHFNNSTKVWTFYDPRPEFEGLNTLTELADGQPYWILVSAAQENVVLNGKTRDLTCVGGDCWNQEVW